MAHIATGDGVVEAPLRGACCVRSSETTAWENRRWRASLAIVGAGGKDLSLGERAYALRAGCYALTLMPLAVLSRFSQASARRPFLALLVPVEASVINSIVEEMDDLADAPPEVTLSPIFIGRVGEEMLDCALRFARTLGSPESNRVLGPGYVRHLLYLVLKGPNGPVLRYFAKTGSGPFRMARVIHQIESELSGELDIHALARSVGMSRSVFFQEFKRATSSTPVGFQKRLRLLEAQRLILQEGSTAQAAAFCVGYQSASQFSREYARMFGAPPIAHLKRLKENARKDREVGVAPRGHRVT